MIKAEYSCPVIDTPNKLCPHFKECLENGKNGKCLLTKNEMVKRKDSIIGYTRRIKQFEKILRQNA